MNAMKYLAAATALIMSAAAMSCSESDKDDSKEILTTHVYLNVADGTTTLTAGSTDTITVDVTLSAAATQNVSLKFAPVSDEASVLALIDNPVTINAGSTTGAFKVSVANSSAVTESTSFTFTLVDATPSFDIKENVTVTVLPATSANPLTPEQLALIETWKSKYGIDLTPWLGNVELSGSLQFPGDGARDPFVAPSTVTLAGSTLFALNEEADEETPVLDMLENPMGMTNYLYRSFLQLTVDDREYFALEDEGTGWELMELINWNSESAETFSVTLPGLRLTSIADGKAEIEFVTTGDNYIYGTNGEPIYNEEYDMELTYNFATSRIPFNYSYSAWGRQFDLVEAGDPLAMELLTFGVSAAPATYLGISDVLEDSYEIDEEEDGVANLYVVPKGEIDFEAGTMTFEFPFDHADQYGYSRVKVVYTLK